MRVLVFGASITQGFYDTKGGWVGRLWEHYTKQTLENSQTNDVTIFNLGISGDGSDRLLKRFQSETAARKFPGQEFCFIFSIGTNNAWTRSSGEAVSTTEQYSKDIKELISQAKEFSDRIMFIGIAPCDENRASPVPWNKDIFFTNARLNEFDQALKNTCQEEKIKYLPIFDAVKERLDKEDIYTDGLHPNNDGHQLIFELVRPELDKLLSSGR